jgi:hypothetical protein
MPKQITLSLLLVLLIITVKADYDPQMMFTVKANTINKAINDKLSKNISDAINNYHIVIPVQN